MHVSCRHINDLLPRDAVLARYLQSSCVNFCACYLRPWLGPPLHGGVAIRYVLPVLWTTSCLHIVARNRRRREKGVDSACRPGPARYDPLGPAILGTIDCLVSYVFMRVCNMRRQCCDDEMKKI